MNAQTNMHAWIEDKDDDDTKDSFYEELACLQCDILMETALQM
jgi:hypothetical protein